MYFSFKYFPPGLGNTAFEYLPGYCSDTHFVLLKIIIIILKVSKLEPNSVRTFD